MTTRAVIGTVCVAMSTVCSAQWNGQLLNSFAVTDESGNIIVLCDEGGAYSGAPTASADKAFDGDVNTWYDASWKSNAWAGFELETPKVITQVRYTGRPSLGSRTGGALIQGANTGDFSDAETIGTLPAPANNWNPATWLTATLISPEALKPFKFVRFLSPDNNGGSFSQVEFYGADPGSTPPAAPELSFHGNINWRMSLRWAREPQTVMFYEIQRKIASEETFSTIRLAPSSESSSAYWRDTSLLIYQDTEYRIRARNPTGDSPWVTVLATATDALTGTWIGTPGSYNNTGNTGEKAFDGDIATFFDGPSATGCWTGLDFGSEKTITAIRYAPRENFPGRTAGSWFEIADNPDFTNPTVIHDIPGTPNPSTNIVTEVVLPTPVTARYARYFSKSPDGNGNIAEVEFVQAPAAPKPHLNLTAATDALTGGTPTLIWTLDTVGSLISSTLVYRATSLGGPYTLMTPDGIDGLQWADPDPALLPNVRYYYTVSALLNAAPHNLEGSPSAPVTFVSAIRLERDPLDPTTIKPGTALLGTHYSTFNNLGVHLMFDGDLLTFPDTTVANSAIGIDLGHPCHITAMRFSARSDQVHRLNGAELRGSNDPDYTNTFTRLATFSVTTPHELFTQKTDSQDAFRYIFVQRPGTDSFHGNITELELYGWDTSTANDHFSAPDTVRISILPTGILLDWTSGTAQDTYRIQRSADGGATWVDLDDNVPTAPYLDAAPLQAQTAHYRVTAIRATPSGEEHAHSASYPVIAYTPGTGTGLTAAYYTNFFTTYNPTEGYAGTFTEQPTPDWAISDAIPIHPDVPGSVSNIRIVWHGTLHIPFTGDYTFHLTSDDGAALRIDDAFIINRWNSHPAATDTATLHLTAGAHPLRLDYFNGGGGKALKLEWDGAVTRAVIPLQQFSPLPLPEGTATHPSIGPWQARTFDMQRLGFQRENPDGSITVGAGGGDLSGNNDQCHLLWQPLSAHDFTFEAKAETHSTPDYPSGKSLLMVRTALTNGAPFLAPVTISANALGRFNIKQRLTPGVGITDALTWSGPNLNPVHLRITRKGDTFHFAYRDTEPGSPWVTYHTHEDTARLFGKDLYIGFGVTAPTPPADTTRLQLVTFSDIDIRTIPSGTLLMLK